MAWFHGELGFPYDPDHDGAVADWVIAVISIGFQKARGMTQCDLDTSNAGFAVNDQRLTHKGQKGNRQLLQCIPWPSSSRRFLAWT